MSGARTIEQRLRAIPSVDIHLEDLADKLQGISKAMEFPQAADLLYVALHVDLLSAALRQAPAGELRAIDRSFRDHLAALANDLTGHS